MLKLRATKTEITIKNLFVNVSLVIFDLDKLSNIHWSGWLIVTRSNIRNITVYHYHEWQVQLETGKGSKNAQDQEYNLHFEIKITEIPQEKLSITANPTVSLFEVYEHD